MRTLFLLLLASCTKPATRCGTVVQTYDSAVVIRIDSVNLIYTPTTNRYALGDKICL